jgi:hypothetical protein
MLCRRVSSARRFEGPCAFVFSVKQSKKYGVKPCRRHYFPLKRLDAHDIAAQAAQLNIQVMTMSTAGILHEILAVILSPRSISDVPLPNL